MALPPLQSEEYQPKLKLNLSRKILFFIKRSLHVSRDRCGYEQYDVKNSLFNSPPDRIRFFVFILFYYSGIAALTIKLWPVVVCAEMWPP